MKPVIHPTQSSPSTSSSSAASWRSYLPLPISAVALTLVFIRPLQELLELSLNTTLYSHVFLIPVVTLYLIWQDRDKLPPASADRPARSLSLIPAAAAALVLWLSQDLAFPAEPDQPSLALSSQIFAYLLFIWAACCLTLGPATLKILSFPLAFLIFLVPFPPSWEKGIEAFFQHTSGELSYWLFLLSDTPILRQGLVFKMPGLTIEVAPQCSGIRSSLVLFITALVGGYLFLRSNWKRAALVGFVIPLAIFRNAARILTLSLLTVHHDPGWIHSDLHHRGGPIFFALSLFPFFLLLFLLWKSERKKKQIADR